ncbi:MAG: hypothetical protein Q8P67_03890 [archaeon]|nr:hypothetical protein [archaeon]
MSCEGETSSSVAVATDAVQIIDDNNEYNHGLIASMQQWGMVERGFDYNVVAILGPQSSGKSTLLNLLFGTTFAVLDATTRRGQTTKGVWCSKALEAPVLVLDVEGTDGRERADDMNFERKSSLFSLALAPVLLINMWYQDVGRWNAANMVLLRVVFELNLQLFLAQREAGTLPKHLLVFVLRDHMLTPVAELRRMILDDMSRLWASITKPEKFAESAVEDFFDFEFVPLPNKVLAADQFLPAVEAFKQWFVNPSSEHYLWKDGRYPVDVPSDGFIHYSSNIWEVIKVNKDLDIPSQKQLLARFRCDEMANQARAAFNADLLPLRTAVEAANPATGSVVVPELGERFAGLLSRALAQYNEPAARYDQQVAAEIRLSLLQQMGSELKSVFKIYLHSLMEQAKAEFDAALASQLESNWEAVRDHWSQTLRDLRSRTLAFFESSAGLAVPQFDFAVLLIDGPEEASFRAEWGFSKDLALLNDGLESRISSGRAALLQRYEDAVRKGFETRLDKPISQALDSAWETPAQLWEKLRSVYGGLVSSVLDEFTKKLTESFECPAREVTQAVARLQAKFLDVLTSLLRSKSAFAKVRMQKRFGSVFDRDEQGLPRRWKPEDNIATIYRKAFESASSVLEGLTILRLDPSQDQVSSDAVDISPEHVLLSVDQCEQIRQEFQQECDSRYYNALRDQENVNAVQKVPLFMIVLLCVLGFNEAVAILTNPFLFVLVLVLSLAVFLVWKLNLYPVIRPVLKTLVQTTASNVKPFAASLLRNIQESPAAGPSTPDHPKQE